jgi:hypothetical protein
MKRTGFVAFLRLAIVGGVVRWQGAASDAPVRRAGAAARPPSPVLAMAQLEKIHLFAWPSAAFAASNPTP